MQRGPTQAELREAFIADICRVWREVKHRFPTHIPYALIVGRETHVEGAYASADTLAVGTDGGLFLAGSVDNPDGAAGGRNEFLGRVSAYDRSGPRLVSRWAFDFPRRGDFICQLALPPAGQPLYALRLRHDEGVATSIVLSLDVRDGGILKHVDLPGEAASFAVRPDGARVAVAIHAGRLTVLDEELRSLRELQVGTRPARLRYLRDGRLLIATDLGLRSLDHDGAELVALTDLPAFWLSTDLDERLLAVSPRPVPRSYFGATSTEELGVLVYSLPDLDECLIHGLPGHQAESAELSPDGTRIAFIASSIDTARTVVVVRDLATGADLVNRRCEDGAELAFTPDGQMLLVTTTSDLQTVPPVDLIPITSSDSPRGGGVEAD